jgi:phosphatidylglycerophosphatase A
MRKIFLSFFFLGYAPFFPGTAGSAGAAAVYLALRYFGADSPYLFLSLAGFFFCLTALLGRWAVAFYGKPDPRQVVSDEVAGYFVSASLFVRISPLTGAIAAFILFRFFDIVKPPPCRRLERLPHGYGIAADDIMAGLYANLLLHAVIFVCRELDLLRVQFFV